jgi:agmatine deiminase
MIYDKITNFVYISDKLRELYEPENEKIISIFNKHNIKHKELTGTRDIWCRDYCPIQVDKSKFIQFDYHPSYLRGDLKIRTNPFKIPELKSLKAIDKTCINLDGGNLIKYKTKAILTDRIYSENCKQHGDKIFLDELKTLLEVDKVFVIPADKEDFTGHADGMVKFIDDKHILLNNYKSTSDKGSIKLEKRIREILRNEFDVISFPIRFDNNNCESAIECYINFLQIGNLIILPVFGFREDDSAFIKITECFPDCKVETININRIAEKGGVMNCITWNLKK